MNDKDKSEKEKMSEAQRKKKADLEWETGVPDPPVPNRAHTEMSAQNHNRAEMSSNHFGKSPFYVDTKKHKSASENLRKHMETE